MRARYVRMWASLCVHYATISVSATTRIQPCDGDRHHWAGIGNDTVSSKIETKRTKEGRRLGVKSEIRLDQRKAFNYLFGSEMMGSVPECTFGNALF
uniref:Putative secreted protein n=1 Tax=Anopheles triannulatus TaxID=58253 RepID=A0A2M4B243_9DIPT